MHRSNLFLTAGVVRDSTLNSSASSWLTALRDSCVVMTWDASSVFSASLAVMSVADAPAPGCSCESVWSSMFMEKKGTRCFLASPGNTLFVQSKWDCSFDLSSIERMVRGKTSTTLSLKQHSTPIHIDKPGPMTDDNQVILDRAADSCRALDDIRYKLYTIQKQLAQARTQSAEAQQDTLSKVHAQTTPTPVSHRH